MKELLLLSMAILLGTAPVWAQTFAEWFQQKRTQIKYLEKQIAALEVYKGIVEKGYQLAKDGTNVIAVIKQGDYELHQQYFASLQNVNPTILLDPNVQSAFRMTSLIKELAEKIRDITANRKTSFVDYSALGAAYADGLISDCNEQEDLLISLSTDGKLQMTDDQRLQAVYYVKTRLDNRYIMAVSHLNDLNALLSKEKS